MFGWWAQASILPAASLPQRDIGRSLALRGARPFLRAVAVGCYVGVGARELGKPAALNVGRSLPIR